MEVVIDGLTDKQKDIANSIFGSSNKYHAINASRQAGKTFLISRAIMAASVLTPDDKILVASPSYEQVKILFDYLTENKSFKPFIKQFSMSKPYKVLTMNNCMIHFKSAERPDNIRGGSYKWVFLDEFAFFKEGVFNSAIVPTTAAKVDSKVVVCSTPKGKHNDFYRVVQQGQNLNPRYKYYKMSYNDNPYYDLEEVESAKLRYPRALYLQEYEGIFLSGGGQVFERIEESVMIEKYQTSRTSNRYFAGIDWGRANDSTVLTLIDENRMVTGQFEIGGEWPEQIERIAAILRVYDPIVYAESNGIGDPLLSSLGQEYGNVRPFVMTNASKKDLVEELRMAMSTGAIGLPSVSIAEKLHKEMEMYEFKVSSSGNIIYSHPTGVDAHDDHIDSLMLADYAYRNHNMSWTMPIVG